MLVPSRIHTADENEAGERVLSWDPLPDNLRRVIIEFAPTVIPSWPPLVCGDAFIGSRWQLLALRRVMEEGQRLGNVLIQTEEDCGSPGDDVSVDKTVLMLPVSMAVYQEDLGKHNETKFALAKKEWLERSADSGKGCWL